VITCAVILLIVSYSDEVKHHLKTGSMRPERFSNTDAPLNVGSAIAAVQVLPNNGVYVTMHGVVRPAHVAARDESGQFI
jgi:L-asparaginase